MVVQYVEEAHRQIDLAISTALFNYRKPAYIKVSTPLSPLVSLAAPLSMSILVDRRVYASLSNLPLFSPLPACLPSCPLQPPSVP